MSPPLTSVCGQIPSIRSVASLTLLFPPVVNTLAPPLPFYCIPAICMKCPFLCAEIFSYGTKRGNFQTRVIIIIGYMAEFIAPRRES